MMDPYDDRDAAPALGWVVEQGRGSLPFALIHGESLVACASWALGDSGVTLVDYSTTWAGIRAAEEPFVLHDALCPLTPAPFIGACVEQAVESGVVVVGCRPGDGSVGRVVTSPVVLPESVVAALDELPSYDFAELVSLLGARFPVAYREAPPEARRVSTLAQLQDLEQSTGR